MTKYWAKGLEGTIFPRKKEKGKVSFLDPWTSLLPSFLKKKLAPDILAIFTESKTQVNGQVKVARARLPFWALVFPKRTYAPPDYPHLQLWFLSHRFAPSISFVDHSQRQLLARTLKQLEQIFTDLRHQNQKLNQTDQVLAINATPFSFIKNPDTREYYWGGQSVRTFHAHLLLIPKNLKKVSIKKNQAPLVYPTKFSWQLFKLILTAKGLSKKVFDSEPVETRITKRGIKFVLSPKKRTDLVEILASIDRILYNLQLSLITAFYQDSQQFLDKLADFMTAERLEEVRAERKELVLLGKERPLIEIRARLEQELLRLGEKFGFRLSASKIDQIGQLLTLDKNGDLASWVDDQVVVLRPGMGYGTLVKETKTRLMIYLVPLDSLLTEGTMESSGYIFTRKVKVRAKPKWLRDVIKQLQLRN